MRKLNDVTSGNHCWSSQQIAETIKIGTIAFKSTKPYMKFLQQTNLRLHFLLHKSKLILIVIRLQNNDFRLMGFSDITTVNILILKLTAVTNSESPLGR